jgi:hypothetical protein
MVEQLFVVSHKGVYEQETYFYRKLSSLSILFWSGFIMRVNK